MGLFKSLEDNLVDELMHELACFVEFGVPKQVGKSSQPASIP